MRHWIAYIAGGLACLGIGAYFYNVLPISHQTVIPATPSVIPAEAGIHKVASRLDSRFLGNDNDSLDNSDNTNGIPPTKEDKTSSIVFGGDIMLGRYVAEVIKSNGADYIFSKIKETVGGANFAIANLEGPLTKINNDPGNQLRLYFDPALTEELSMAGFDAFSLANNHSLDQGVKGFADTKKNLDAVGIKYFGDPASANGNVYEFTNDDKKIAVLGFQMVNGKLDPMGYAKTIAAAKQNADIVIVMPHWGVEYQHNANQTQKYFAHQFIDAGADIVVGSHPHVVEGIEMYKNKPIFYSLGNLVFDQYFSTDTQEGMMLRLNFSGDKETIDLLPYNIPHSQPVLTDGVVKAKMLQDIASWSDTELKDQIITGSLKF
jgi:poly-gamma-glutamate synthesis protein (capsule biosynthesis protein)